MDVLSKLTVWARRAGKRSWTTIGAAVVLTVLCGALLDRLGFSADLTALLPDDHPDLVKLRQVQAKRPTGTGFMVLISRNYHFAVDEQGRAMRHDGIRWQRTETGRPLYAVWGFSETEAYAAGAGGRIHRYGAKGSWQPVGSGTDVSLRGLWGQVGKDKKKKKKKVLYAVGDSGVILAGDGRTFALQRSGVKVNLRAVHGNDAGALYAVGDGGTVLRRSDEGSWIKETTPSTTASLRGVWVASGGEVFTVGVSGLALHRDGEGRWHKLRSATRRDLSGIWGASASDVTAVGDGGTILRYLGDAKKGFVIDPHPSNTTQNLRAVFGLAAEQMWAIGAGCIYQRHTDTHKEWFHGPYDTQDAAAGCEAAAPSACDSTFTAMWKPKSDLSKVLPIVPKLAARIAKSPLVERVDYQRPVEFFTDRALYYLSVEDLQKLNDKAAETLERETARGTGLYVDLEEERSKSQKRDLTDLLKKYGQTAARATQKHYVEHDGASIGILAYARQGFSDMGDLRRLHAELKRIVAAMDIHKVDPLARIDIGGDGVNKINEYEETIADINRLAWPAIIGIILILLAYFRRIVGLLFIVVPLAMSIVWTFGLVVLTIGTLNVITGFLFAVLFGLGIDYGLQLYGRYRQERQAGQSVDEAMDQAVLETGRATVTSAVTSAAALLTLLITDFKGFSEFGFIAGIGVLLAVAAFLCVLPAMVLLAERYGQLRIPQLPEGSGRAEKKRERPVRLPRAVVVGSALLALAGLYATTRVQFEYNHRELRPVGRPNEISDRTWHANGGTFSPTLVLASSRDQLRAAIDAVRRNKKRLGKKSTVKEAHSILDLIPDRQPEKRQLLRQLHKTLSSKRWRLVSDDVKRRYRIERLRRMTRAEPFTLEELPEMIRRHFRGPGYGNSWIGSVSYLVNISDSREAQLLKKEVGNFSGSDLLAVGRLLPDGARVFVEGQRVEVDCGDEASKTASCISRLEAARHGGKPVFTAVMTAAEAYDKELAVEDGLRGSLLAIARDGLVPVAHKLAGRSPVSPSGRFHATSGELVVAEVVDVMLADGRIAFVLALCVVFLACVIDLRSFKLAALSCLPLGIGLAWVFLVLWLLQLKLNMFNFVVLPVLVGIGIDYGIHFVHRATEERGPGAVERARGALYWVLLFCAATSIIGFGNMALARHPGLESLGQLAIIGLSCLFVASTYALPAMLQLVRRR